jgi:hypothetical protein
MDQDPLSATLEEPEAPKCTRCGKTMCRAGLHFGSEPPPVQGFVCPGPHGPRSLTDDEILNGIPGFHEGKPVGVLRNPAGRPEELS